MKTESTGKGPLVASHGSPLYTMQRCRANGRKFGETHFAHHEFETLCGLETDQNWWVLNDRGDGFATCKKCNRIVEPIVQPSSEMSLSEEMAEAWKIIDVLYMDALDNNGEAWPRAREWMERNRRFSPNNQDSGR